MSTRRAETRSGVLLGRADGGVVRFSGVPFAAAPCDGLRFRHPLPIPPWPGERTATTPAPAPLQPPVLGLGMRGAARCDEDCLYLNVVTPAVDAGRRPVLLWLFGGAYQNGDAADPLFDGARLATTQDIVVVTCNYRLGAFGFAALGDANCGLADQIAALRWIRDHIASFGGDPDTVCVAGESAGAMSVCNLLAAPAAKGLFHRAIVQSGAADNVADADEAAAVAAALRRVLGADPMAAAADVVLAAQVDVSTGWRQQHRTMAFRPWVDGDLLPEAPLQSAATSRLPLVMGTNRHEQRLYVRPSFKVDARALASLLERRLTNRHPDPRAAVQQVLHHYRHERPQAPVNANAALLADVDTELRFRRPLLAYARARRAPTWIYQFDWPSPALRGWLGACHAIEIPFVFGNFDPPGTARFVGAGPDAAALSRQVMATWGHFVRHGEPPAGWPRFDPADPRQLHLNRECAVRRLADDPTTAFWDDLLA
jgi:para-nitrobenzyl esterase